MNWQLKDKAWSEILRGHYNNIHIIGCYPNNDLYSMTLNDECAPILLTFKGGEKYTPIQWLEVAELKQ